MKCLLVIDVQNGFVSTKTAFVVPRILELMETFKDEFIVATKFLNYEESPYRRFMGWERLTESPETDILPEVEEKAYLVLEKAIYSACKDKFCNLLAAKGITEVYLVGIDTDCCVLKTATDLFERGIRPIVLEHYCASNGGEESHEAALRVMERTIGCNQIICGKFNVGAETK